jgi:tRNA-2-methylthio-N6-dimethylallyladenosine synthase
MTRKLYIKTFGCQMNEYDSAKMADVLGQGEPIESTDDPGAGRHHPVQHLLGARKSRRENLLRPGPHAGAQARTPGLIVGVGGCVASQEGANIVARAPYVDVVFGPQTLHRLPALIEARRRTGRAQVDISFPEIEKFDHLPPARVEGASAFVSIMEGCSKYCSFCVVPFYPRRRSVAAVRRRAGRGRRTGRAGRARSHAAGPERQCLPRSHGRRRDRRFRAAAGLRGRIPGIERIRYTTSHPKEFSARLIEAYRRIPKLVDHVHLPVQSGSDRILAAMKRGYTALEYKSIIRRLRAARPASASAPTSSSGSRARPTTTSSAR